MSSSHERQLKLMAYADGELEGAERAEVERWLAEDTNAARFAIDVANLGDLMKTGHAHSATGKAIASFDIADAIMGEVVKEPKVSAEGAKEGAQVRSLDAARSRKSRTQSTGLKIGAGIAAALALAASVFLVERSKVEQPMAQVPATSVQSVSSSGIDVDVDETPGHSVSVFYVPNESMATTSVVVWLDESGGE